jgi:hypothetical protein
MKQTSLELGQSSKLTRRRIFLEEMDRVVPWSDLVALISPYMPEVRRGRPPFALEVMLRIHFMQQWFNLSDPAMEEALHDMALFRDFAGLAGWDERVPDESTILRFRRVEAEQEGQSVVLRHEGPHRRGRRLRPGAHGARHDGQRERCDRGQRAAARRGDRSLR